MCRTVWNALLQATLITFTLLIDREKTYLSILVNGEFKYCPFFNAMIFLFIFFSRFVIAIIIINFILFYLARRLKRTFLISLSPMTKEKRYLFHVFPIARIGCRGQEKLHAYTELKLMSCMVLLLSSALYFRHYRVVVVPRCPRFSIRYWD